MDPREKESTDSNGERTKIDWGPSDLDPSWKCHDGPVVSVNRHWEMSNPPPLSWPTPVQHARPSRICEESGATDELLCNAMLLLVCLSALRGTRCPALGGVDEADPSRLAIPAFRDH